MTSVRIVLPLLLALLPVLSACDQSPEPTIPRERSFLSVIHAYDELNAIDVELESFSVKKTVADGLTFSNTWPAEGYASLLSEAGAGIQDTGVIIRLKDWRSKDAVSPDRVISIVPGRKSTVGIIDSMGVPDVIQIVDDYDTPAPGRANLRFMNLCHLYPAVNLVSQNDSISIERINYLLASKFLSFPAGTYDLYFRHSFTGRNVDSIKNIRLDARKTYNVFLTQDGTRPEHGITEFE